MGTALASETCFPCVFHDCGSFPLTCTDDWQSAFALLDSLISALDATVEEFGTYKYRDSRILRVKDPRYRGTSLRRNRTPLGPYRRLMPRMLGGSYGAGCFFNERGTPVTWHDGWQRAFELLDSLISALDATVEESEISCRSKSAHIRQSRPDFGLDFQVKFLRTFQVVLSYRSGAVR